MSGSRIRVNIINFDFGTFVFVVVVLLLWINGSCEGVRSNTGT